MALCFKMQFHLAMRMGYGDLNKFAAPNISRKLEINKALTRKIYELAQQECVSSILANALFKINIIFPFR